MKKESYNLKDDPNTIFITGGREESVMVKLVQSNYHAKEPNEMLLSFSGPVSLGTLKEVFGWLDERANLITKNKEELIILK